MIYLVGISPIDQRGLLRLNILLKEKAPIRLSFIKYVKKNYFEYMNDINIPNGKVFLIVKENITEPFVEKFSDNKFFVFLGESSLESGIFEKIYPLILEKVNE